MTTMNPNRLTNTFTARVVARRLNTHCEVGNQARQPGTEPPGDSPGDRHVGFRYAGQRTVAHRCWVISAWVGGSSVT